MELEERVAEAMRIASEAGVELDSDDDIVTAVLGLIRQRDEALRHRDEAWRERQLEVELHRKVEAFQKREIERVNEELTYLQNSPRRPPPAAPEVVPHPVTHSE